MNSSFSIEFGKITETLIVQAGEEEAIADRIPTLWHASARNIWCSGITPSGAPSEFL